MRKVAVPGACASARQAKSTTRISAGNARLSDTAPTLISRSEEVKARLTPPGRLPDAVPVVLLPAFSVPARTMTPRALLADDRLTRLFEDFSSGSLDRREFMRRAAVMGVAGAAAATLAPLASGAAEAAALARQTAAAATKIPLDVAEWSYMWVNVKRAEVASRGAFVGGQQMYVEYMIPARVRHPFPVVLVHGGGGQGTDWLGTPDGRPGWFQYLVQEGFKVYVVDRPGHGRSPLHPELHGAFPAQALTLESIAGRFTPPSANPAQTPNEYQKNHSQWPGPGNVGSPDLNRLTAGMGGSYVTQPPAAAGRGAAPAGRGGGGQGGRGAAAGPPPPANAPQPGQPPPPVNVQHLTWRQAG